KIMKGEKSVCPVCNEEFTKKMYTQVNCSTRCSIKKTSINAKDRNGVVKFKIFARDGFKCFYCGKSSIEKDARLVLDHLIPQTNGGRSTPINLVTCCTECNNSKLQIMLHPDL